MAKEKLFTPEDFDKPKKSKFTWKKILISLGAVAVIVAGWGLYSYLDKEDVIERGEVEEVEEGTIAGPIDTVTVGIQNPIDTISVVPEEPINPIDGDGGSTGTNIQQEVDKEKPHKTPEETKGSPTVSDNIEVEAYNVIRGDYGCVPERRQILGDKFQQIQNRVNQLKRQGVF